MRQLPRRVTIQASAKIRNKNAKQQIAQTRFAIGIAEMLLHQIPERHGQIVGGNVLPSLRLCRQVRSAINHARRVQALQHRKQVRRIRPSQYSEHFAIKVERAVPRLHQSLKALNAILCAQEFVALFQVLSQRLRHQPQVFKQDGG